MSLQVKDDLQQEKTKSEAVREQAVQQASDAKKDANGLLTKVKSDAAEEQAQAQRAADKLSARLSQAEVMLSDATKYAPPQDMRQMRQPHAITGSFSICTAKHLDRSHNGMRQRMFWCC